jgi:hypothetical protein
LKYQDNKEWMHIHWFTFIRIAFSMIRGQRIRNGRIE